jgi:HAD superfamily hydrolase (TIGR01484 family)
LASDLLSLGTMSGYFRALAFDYDGTLAAGGTPPARKVVEALRRMRSDGRRVVLATGRILAELHELFPKAADLFDLIVAENGAVLASGDRVRTLAPPVGVELDRALVERGIAFRRGQAIVATSGEHDASLLAEIRRCGLDCQLARNRGELMVVPAGVSKGIGLREGLAQLGISPHSVLAVGDAENDLSLLEVCELGVAVADAVPSLKARADVVLRAPDGAGVLGLLDGPLLGGTMRIEPSRWHVALGQGPTGDPVRLPASQIDLLIAGGSGSGKSFAAGLIAEQLLELGYTLCVIDPEGDHGPLAHLPGVVSFGGAERLPEPEQLVRILQQSLRSAVVDLSLAPAEIRQAWLDRALPLLERGRAETGVPHWVVIDEAHGPLGGPRCAEEVATGLKGHCMVTYQPEQIAKGALADLDFALFVAGEHGVEEEVVEAVCEQTAMPCEALEPHLDDVEFGEALLVRVGPQPDVRRLALGPRWVRHVRHWHKYVSARLPPERRFYFRSGQGATGAEAGNLEELHRELRRAAVDTLRHHALRGDLSRWLDEVIRDELLASAFRTVERRLREGSPAREIERGRSELLAALEARYAP